VTRGYKEALTRRLELVSSREGQTPNPREAEGDAKAYLSALQESALPAVVGLGPGVAVSPGQLARRRWPGSRACRRRRSVGAGGREGDSGGRGETRGWSVEH
jgi:hypothetical protein